MSSTTNRHPVAFAGCLSVTPTGTPWTLVGIKDDSKSSFMQGSADAPPAVRSAYDGNCFNATTESGVDLSARVHDIGDFDPKVSWPASAEYYRERLEALVSAGKVPFVIGGDHAITVPVVRSLRVLDKPVHVIQIDAHPDLYPDFEGDRDSHACTGARMLEMAHVASLTQLGIRAMTRKQEEFGLSVGSRLHVYEARELTGPLPSLDHIPIDAPVYITVDLDGFDPSVSPGVSHPVPGGLTARQVLNFLQAGHWDLVGMDVVEVNPSRDFQSQTAVLAGRVLHEGMGYAANRFAIKGS